MSGVIMNLFVCTHIGTEGMAESGTSWMFHDLRANVWMLWDTIGCPEQFKMNTHRKIGDHFSSYCENITRRAKQKAGCWRGSSSQCDKTQTVWLSTHNGTTNTPLMLRSTEHSRHTTSTLRPRSHPLKPFIWMRPVNTDDAVGLPMQKALPKSWTWLNFSSNTMQHHLARCDSHD